jgi:Tfp pilus assembly protein PilZ
MIEQAELLFGERRQFERKKCLRMIGINNHDQLYAGHLRDLALGGAFLEPKEGIRKPKIGQELLLSIPFGLRNGYVNVKATVAWMRHNGIGVRFQKCKSGRNVYR